jgi:copper transport protein
VRRALTAAALAGLVLVATASAAAAHAELVTSDPAPGAALPAGAPPAAVTLEFTEAVSIPNDAVVLYDAAGDEVGGVGAAEAGGAATRVRAGLPSLDDGAYVVAWRVVSSDSHPITGAFTFTVGEAAAADPSVVAGLRGGADRTVGVVFGAVRWIGYAAVLLTVGILVFALVWPGALEDGRVRTTWWAAALLTIVTALLGIGLQAAYTSGATLGGVADRDDLADVLGTRFGRWTLVRAVAGLGLVALVARWSRLPRRARLAGTAALGAGVLTGVTAVGHAATGRWIALAIAADLVHLGAAAAWLGGLAVLGILALRRPLSAPVRDGVRRFSALATVAIPSVVLTGAIQAFRQSDGLDSVVDTTYGRFVLVKVAAVVFVVAAASVSRELVHRRGALHTAEGGRDLFHAIGAELAFAAIAIAATAVLTYTVPARTAVAIGSSEGTEATDSAYRATLTDDLLELDLTIEPARPGSNDVSVEVSDDSGAPFSPIELTMRAREVTRDLAPIDIGLTETGTGRYGGTLTLPFAGTWELEIRALRTDVDQEVVRAQLEVG